jgi:hypothetical protein
LTVSSQTGIISKERICFPVEEAKLIAADLVRGDSAMAELKTTQNLLSLSNDKIKYLEGINESLALKNDYYKEEIVLYNQKEDKYKYIVTGLEKNNRKLGVKVKVLGFSVSVLSIALAVSMLIN